MKISYYILTNTVNIYTHMVIINMTVGLIGMHQVNRLSWRIGFTPVQELIWHHSHSIIKEDTP